MNGRGIGRVTPRLEDDELLRGRGRFTADLEAVALHACFVRADVAHGRVVDIDTDAAAARPGVVAVFTAAELALAPLRGHAALDPVFDRPPLATDRVRFVGEAVAVVVALERAEAVDAAEAVVVEIEPLAPLVDQGAALAEDAVVLFPAAGTNLAFEQRAGTTDDPLAGAEVVVRLELVNQRVASAPMEADGCLAVPAPDGRLTVWASTQRVHHVRDAIAASLGLDPDAVRVRAPQVGGGFGGKFDVSPETVVVAAAARRLGRPVRWAQTRWENLVGMPHGRGQRQRGALGLRRDGTFVGLDVEVVADAGAYPMVGAVIPNATALMAPGPYRFEAVRAVGRAATTTTTPVGAFRGAGRPEATALLERLVDRAAAELGIDPVQLRVRNLVTADEFPYRSATGMTYDSGDYARSLLAAVAALDEAVPPGERSGRLVGTGVAVWLDCTPMNRPGERAELELVADGDRVRVIVRDGANDQGQAHRTTWALLIEEVLGMPLDAVLLEGGDTDEVPTGEGTGSARSLMLAGGAVTEAAVEVLERARLVAADLLEAAPEDIVVTAAGALAVRGSADRSVSWLEVVRRATEERSSLSPGLSEALGPAPFRVAADHVQPGPTFPSGAHAARVAVDPETGSVELLGFAAVDDCGTVVNPVVVEGQQHGGIVQGIAQALFEAVVHDPDGNPSTASFADYGIPSAAEVPSLSVATAPTTSPVSLLGAKGIGQAGAIGSTVAVQNAVVAALAPSGVTHVDLPCVPEAVWRALAAAELVRRSGPPETR